MTSLFIRSFWEDEEMGSSTTPSSISISEDETNVYVEITLPGIDPKDIEITFDTGVL